MSSVDVFVPCYNYGRYLPDCVASVLAQEGVDIRILIIDDASTDGSAEVARQLAETDRRITLALHHTNQGHIATYNEGIAWAAADYMLLLSADDMVAPGAFGRAVDVMDRRATVGMVYGRACKFSTITEIPPWELQSEGDTSRVITGRSFLADLCAKPTNPVETATAIVRTRVQKVVGGYRPELPHAGDLEMWLRFAAVGDVANIDVTQAFVRIHDANMRRGYSINHDIGDFQQRIACFKIFFGEFLASDPESRRLLAKAERSIAHEILWRAIRLLEAGKAIESARLASSATDACPEISRDLLWLKFQLRRLVRPMAWHVLAGR